MTVLAIDTALGRGSVALWRDGTCLARRIEDQPRVLAEKLVPMIETAMAEASITYGDLDRIGVVTGPGTFTGLRIGVAVARGLMLASGTPVWGITSLEALALSHQSEAQPGERLIVGQDARRGQLFVQTFDSAPSSSPSFPVPVDTPTAIDRETLSSYTTAHLETSPIVVIGSGAALADDAASSGDRLHVVHGADQIDVIAVARWVAAQPPRTQDDAPPRPFYLRAPDAKLPAQAAV